MATTSFFPIGTKLKRKDPATSVYADVPQVANIAIPSITTDYDDVTNHDSVGGYKEYQALLKDPGEITGELIYDPANAMHNQLFADNEAGIKLGWRIVLPNAAAKTWTFDAFLSGLTMPLDTTRSARLGFTLRVSGAPVIS
jgi:hypothetical protein